MVPARTNPSRLPRYAFCLAISCEFAILFGLYYYADWMRPDQPGNAKDFWQVAGWIRWPGYEPRLGGHGDYRLDGDRYYYTMGHLHGSSLYSIPRQEALQIWPEVRSNLESLLSNGPIVSPSADAYEHWRASDSNDLDALLARIQENVLESNSHILARQQLSDFIFYYRVERAKKYYANFLFDFLWLSFIVWVVFYPLIRRVNYFRAYLHWLLAPILLLLPAYLGYAADSYGPMGPSGGVLYPNIIVFLRGGSLSETDLSIIRALPPVLQSLSQDFGEDIVLHGYGPWGPLPLLAFGAVLGIGSVALVRWRRIVDARCETEWSVV